MCVRTGNTQHVDDEAPRQAKARIRQRITQKQKPTYPRWGGELRHNMRVNLCTVVVAMGMKSPSTAMSHARRTFFSPAPRRA